MVGRNSKGRSVGGETRLAVRVTPRARKNEITEVLEDGTVKIRLKAPPVEGKANRVLIKYLAEVLDLRSSQIEILAGESARDKLVCIQGLDETAVRRQIFSSVEG
jgi:uncharacterized protein (TIGR00251 family)